MSNHDGSYLINKILFLLNRFDTFNILGKEKTLQFLKEIRKIGYDHDCNNGEILERIGEALGVCFTCWEYGSNLESGVCKECRSEWYINKSG